MAAKVKELATASCSNISPFFPYLDLSVLAEVHLHDKKIPRSLLIFTAIATAIRRAAGDGSASRI